MNKYAGWALVAYWIALVGMAAYFVFSANNIGASVTATRYAFVLTASSRGEKDANTDPIDKSNFWLNEVRVYSALREAGFEAKNIRVLYADGKPAFDETMETLNVARIKKEQFSGKYDNMATIENIQAELARFAGLVKPDDIFVMYLGTHGAPSFVEIQVGDLDMLVSDLQKMLEKVRPSFGLFYSDACHSGAFIAQLNLSNYILVSTTGQHTYGWGDRYFSGGAYFFQSLIDGESDVDVDGKITVEEALFRSQERANAHMQRIDQYLRNKYNFNQGVGGYDELMKPGGTSSVVQNMIVEAGASADYSLYNSFR